MTSHLCDPDDEDEYGTDSAEAGGVRYDTASQKELRRSRRRKLSMLRILLIVAVVVSFSVKAKVLSWVRGGFVTATS